ncbi:hypothetical protein [Paracoccus suum]|nr:hypothetical protein [Paracoccus suum]
MQLFLHVGAHKTATTHLQSRLNDARPRLWPRHIACICPQQTREAEIQLSTMAQFPGRWPKKELAWRKRLELIESEGVTRCVISDENLIGEIRRGSLVDGEGTIYPQAARRLESLLDILGRKPDQIFLGLREPASFVTSAFGMWMRAGEGVLIEDFLGDADPRRIRWADLARRLGTLPGQPHLTVWRFEDYPRIRNRVVAALVGEEAAPVVGTSPRRLVGWSQAAYDAFVQSVLQVDESVPLSTLAQAALKAFPRGSDDPALTVLAPEVTARCEAEYEGDVADMVALPGVTLID